MFINTTNMNLNLISWNVAGLRACIRKEALNFLEGSEHDIVCLQETKCEQHEAKLPRWITDTYPYRFWNSTQGTTQRKGLSGTAIWSKVEPLTRIETPDFDTEGRIVALEYKKFILVTVYTPNSQGAESERFGFRVSEWDALFRDFIVMLEQVKPVIVCGDFNVAHEERDVYKPDEWRNKSPGFFDVERENFSALLSQGYVDTFRMFNQEERQYTYWQQTIPVYRKRNIGWRIDYFVASNKFTKYVKGASICPDIMGSDHCPVTCTLRFPPKKLTM
ncbi:MAG: exodeoxyribonuclease III [Candidatus Thorarchaeota archaeon]|jgi:exodeoxyribonuclease III